MKYVLLSVLITISVSAMEPGSTQAIRDFYSAIKENRYPHVKEMLAKNKCLVNASFADLCKEFKESTGEQETPLLCAIKENREKIFRKLVRTGADVNQAAENGLTPLLCALLNQRGAFARKLLEKGADTYVKIHIFQGSYADALTLAKNMGLKETHTQILNKRRELNHLPTVQREPAPAN